MALKIEWNGREFWVKVGTGNNRIAAKRSKDIEALLREWKVPNWKYSFRAKQQIKREDAAK